MKRKGIAILPFMVFCGAVLYCWFGLLTDNYNPSIKHIVALVLSLFNLVVYFWNFKYALVLSGFILLAASVSLISIQVVHIETSFFLKLGEMKISSPGFNYLSLVLLVFYLVVNYKIIKFLFKVTKE